MLIITTAIVAFIIGIYISELENSSIWNSWASAALQSSQAESSLGYIRFPFFFPLRPPPRENRIKLYLAFAPMLNWFSRRGFREISVNFHYTLFRDIYEVYGRQFPFSFEAARASRCKLSWRIIDVYARLRSCRCDKKLFNSWCLWSHNRIPSIYHNKLYTEHLSAIIFPLSSEPHILSFSPNPHRRLATLD